MAGKRFQGDHGCCRDRADGSCALTMVGRLSEERARRVLGRGDVTVVKLRPIVPSEPGPAGVGGASRRGGEMSRGRREGHHDEARALRWQ
jgi:hypothetical protein